MNALVIDPADRAPGVDIQPTPIANQRGVRGFTLGPETSDFFRIAKIESQAKRIFFRVIGDPILVVSGIDDATAASLSTTILSPVRVNMVMGGDAVSGVPYARVGAHRSLYVGQYGDVGEWLVVPNQTIYVVWLSGPTIQASGSWNALGISLVSMDERFS